MKIDKRIISLFFIVMIFVLSGCNGGDSQSVKQGSGSRDNTPIVLEPKASGENIIGNEKIIFDISNTDDGYIMAKYEGDNAKVKVRIQNPGQNEPYTYDVSEGYNVFPLTGGDGQYTVSAYENISDNKYSHLYTKTIQVNIDDELSPYLYPNQFVNFDSSTKAIDKGSEIVKNADNDLDAVKYVYDYVINNISYDGDNADLIKKGKLSGYLPKVDETLEEKKGICFDYSAVMATMLRTQNIPTRMMIGYVSLPSGSLYHAWISVYIEDIGWVDDLIEFDGKNWSMMDPTLISDGKNSSEIRDFTSNKDNYLIKYLY